MTKPTTNLRPEVALALADLLESGEFEQCKGVLRRGDAMCVAGALCELYRRKTGHGRWLGGYFGVDRIRSSRTVLPRDNMGSPWVVRDWATTDGDFPRLGDREMVYLNDDGATFPELARMLRKAAGGQSDG